MQRGFPPEPQKEVQEPVIGFHSLIFFYVYIYIHISTLGIPLEIGSNTSKFILCGGILDRGVDSNSPNATCSFTNFATLHLSEKVKQ